MLTQKKIKVAEQLRVKMSYNHSCKACVIVLSRTATRLQCKGMIFFHVILRNMVSSYKFLWYTGI